MYRHVFKQKSSRVFRGRFRLSDGPKIYDVPLHTDKRYIAETKLHRLIREKEEELAGLLAPKPLRDGVQKPIQEHLADYVADLAAQRRSKKHVALAKNRISRLCGQCGWEMLSDISSDDFNRWRAAQVKLGPKTCNEYLGLASAFLTWLERNQRLAYNPLRRVAKAETRGKERRKRRALSQTEVDLLVSKSGEHGLAYFLGAYTGLRRGEMKRLMWSDVHLDAPKPFIEIRASTTKNYKSALIPLVPALAEALRARRVSNSDETGKVFRLGVPTPQTLRDDLKTCGIAVCDDLGRVVDFHALRHTFATMLARAGIPPRVAMELMRHSDMRLTQSTYTDATLLPLFNEVEKLPCPSPSPGASLNSAKTGQNEGKPVQGDPAYTSGEIVAISESGTHLGKAVPSWENSELAERVGFEPTVPFGTPDFESGTIDHSVTSPGPGAETAKTTGQMKAEKGGGAIALTVRCRPDRGGGGMTGFRLVVHKTQYLHELGQNMRSRVFPNHLRSFWPAKGISIRSNRLPLSDPSQPPS